MHRLSLAAGCALDTDARGIIEAAAGAGFDSVGLRLSAAHAVTSPGTLQSVASFARSLGVAVHDVEVHRIGQETRASNHPVTDLLDAAASVGATGVLVVSDLASEADTIAEVDRIARLCDDRGLVLGLEYMAWTNPSTPSAALTIARQTGCRVIVDLLHHVRVGAGVAELRSIIEADALAWVQVCDAPRARPGRTDEDLLHEARHTRLLPGTGDLPLTELLAVVPDPSVISVEVQSDVLAAAHHPPERARLLRDAAVSVLTHRG
jgi:sugar phosphate isomerase/epimerase